MKTLSTNKLWTDDQLMALDRDGRKHEVWFGKVITMPPAGSEHGDIIVRLIVAIGAHVARHKLGKVYEGQTGFRLGPDHCFEPDVSFVSKERLKLILPAKEKLFHGAPDLAVEVLSPSDSITKTEEKLGLYLTHGTRLAWMIDPKTKTARVYRPSGESELLRRDRVLTGNSVLPGFRISLSRLFED
ncbi:MAG: Uma2 family endonuclease [Verrucomicrobia bacterium]|nr:Uma2 family endonuclease [Verrucomicrobiota bacterium]